jgi:DMSO/TMAO reductase YedYZ molybdopterin-dependent catalytic subunit
VTPTSRYFVRNHFATPTIDHEHWRLSVEGDVERPFIMT